MVEDLTRRKILRSDGAHLGPDLDWGAIPRSTAEWTPSLGQVPAPQAHLANNDVKVSDLLLFFGWFRRVTNVARKWRYVAAAPDLHVLFGLLQVGKIIRVGGDPSAVIARYPWLVEHPHLAESYASYKGYRNNTTYMARKFLSLPGIKETTVPGGGVFPRFNSSLALTAPDQSKRSLWLLAKSFLS